MTIDGMRYCRVRHAWVPTFDTEHKRKRRGEVFCGIYSIKLESLKKVYVGKSVDIYVRWATHKSSLTGGYSENSEFAGLWKEYSNEFEFNIEEITSVANLAQRELEIAHDYKKAGYTLINDCMVENWTTTSLNREHKPTIKRTLHLLAKGRLSLKEIEEFLDKY